MATVFQFDFPSHEYDHINRVGFEYQGDYSERTWAHSTFGYRIENENGTVGDLFYPPSTSGQRLNNDAYLQQQVTLGRLSVIAGGRFVHSSLFGNTGVPRVALTLLALRGGEFFSGTRLRFSYATGFMEPALYQTFANLPYYVPNPRPVAGAHASIRGRSRTKFARGSLGGERNLLQQSFPRPDRSRSQSAAISRQPPGYTVSIFNVQQSLAEGAEFQLQGKIRTRLLFNAAYTNLSTRYVQAPLCTPGEFLRARVSDGRSLTASPETFGNHAPQLSGDAMGGKSGWKLRGPASRFRF